ncbi:GrpB family protein [Bacillus sp. S/N-304-OC-R1]|uniref:GrpB family protein n=1 Tax=Bacillus sp. S/N-304-OC-R1 TaxID=2758034 RepID=UPI001C8D8AF4|nr:GrpB family protein [Bacillus sp. S/N-304-OC-R1]MBY0121637.1 GrpB family protein [Bacillus sp. S/N-304-OC-R1]
MKVRLTDYTENWRWMFEQEVQFLKSIFGEVIISFEHFGSTSIPGMKAKPVIDMMCIVNDIEQIDTYNEQMKSFEYDVAGEWGIKGRRLFRKGGEHRTHHIHFYQFDNPQIIRHLVFRDYLLVHQDEARRYSEFKQVLANKYPSTRDYSPAKKSFVSEMENKALAWYKGTKERK